MSRHVEVFLEQTDALELLADCDAVALGGGACDQATAV